MPPSRKCVACKGETETHDRHCPDRPRRVAQPHRPHVVAVLLSTTEREAFDFYRCSLPRSEGGRNLVKEGTTTKIRPVMAHNTSPNGGDCWSEADFATLPLDRRAGVSGCRLEVPVEDGAIVRLYPVEDGATPQWLAGGWYWVAGDDTKDGEVELEAGFSDAVAGTGFSFKVRGIYPRTDDEEVRRTRKSPGMALSARLNRALEVGAKRALDAVIAEFGVPMPAGEAGT